MLHFLSFVNSTALLSKFDGNWLIQSPAVLHCATPLRSISLFSSLSRLLIRKHAPGGSKVATKFPGRHRDEWIEIACQMVPYFRSIWLWILLRWLSSSRVSGLGIGRQYSLFTISWWLNRGKRRRRRRKDRKSLWRFNKKWIETVTESFFSLLRILFGYFSNLMEEIDDLIGKVSPKDSSKSIICGGKFHNNRTTKQWENNTKRKTNHHIFSNAVDKNDNKFA